MDTINLVDRVIKGAAMDNMALALAEAIMVPTTTVEDGVVITGTNDISSQSESRMSPLTLLNFVCKVWRNADDAGLRSNVSPSCYGISSLASKENPMIDLRKTKGCALQYYWAPRGLRIGRF